jgi:hypothetical protein
MICLTCNAQEDAFFKGSVEDVLCDDARWMSGESSSPQRAITANNYHRASNWEAGDGGHFDSTHESDVADIDHVRQAFQRVKQLLEVRLKDSRILEYGLLLVYLEGSNAGRHGEGVSTVQR